MKWGKLIFGSVDAAWLLVKSGLDGIDDALTSLLHISSASSRHHRFTLLDMSENLTRLTYRI